jgi:Concanavalin A-like lectin/glucanases superfamily/Immunoglobulin I-set domain
MKRHINSKSLKKLFLAVPASALMLGSSQAQTTVGLNFQGYYYGAGTTNAMTIGFGAGYQTTGFPVTATAFGVSVQNWTSTEPLPGQSSISANVTFGPGGVLTATISAPDAWESGIGEQVAGWNPETVPPGNDEVTWAYLDDGNATGDAPSVSVSGLASLFPHGYVIQTIAAEANVATFDPVTFTDGTTNEVESYTTYYIANPINDGTDLGGTVGLAQSIVFTNDTIGINPDPKTAGNRSTLAGFIITDIPAVTQPPNGTTNIVGGAFTLTAGAIGIPPLSYQWQLDGTNISGATASAYTNADAAASAGGDYTVVVTNQYGVTTSQVANVSILLAPAIGIDLPPAVTNYSTMNASFNVLAQGPPPLTYTWMKNGQSLPVTNAILDLTNLQTSDAGSYQVIVANSAGSVTSKVVNLTVLSSVSPYEGFDYSPGDLAGQSGGTGWTGTWTEEATYNGDHAVIAAITPWVGGISQLDTTGNALELAAVGSADYDDIRGLLTTLGGNGSGTIYLSFESQITNTTWGGIELVQDGTTSIFLGSCWEGANWGWGGRAAPVATTSVSPFTFSLLVYRFDFTPTNTAIRLYVNPTALSTEPSSADASGTQASLLTFNELRIVSHGYLGSGAGPDGVMDEIRIGGSWAAVTPHELETNAPFALQMVPGGIIEDTKPDGTPHPGLNHNTTWVASSTDNNSVTRTGVEQFSTANGGQITIPPDTDFDSTNGTICFWMLFSLPNNGFPGKGNEAAMLFDRRTTNGTIIGLNLSGGIEFQAAGGVNHFVGTSYLVDGNWHEIAITYDQSSNGVVSLYVDGSLDTSQANTNVWTWPATQEIELGRSHDTYWYIYDGQMDDFRMYNTILSPSEISAIATPATSDDLEEPTALEVRFNFDSGTNGTSIVWPFGTLQSSPTLGPGAVWTTLSNAVSPQAILPTSPVMFYRLFGTP